MAFATDARPRPSRGGSSTTRSQTLVAEARPPIGSSREDLAEQLATMAATADTLVDITTAFTLERGDEAEFRPDCSGPRAVQRSIASHLRDLAGSNAPAGLSARLSTIARTGAGHGLGDGFRVPA